AVRFTPAGGRVTLTARRAGDRIRIGVSDTGPCISPEDQETIFEEFRQGAGGNGQRGTGTGLGLPMARRLVELHGGRLWVESKIGAGSTFTDELPTRPRFESMTDHIAPPATQPRATLALGHPD